MEQQITDMKFYNMRIALDTAKANIISAIEQIMKEKSLNKISFAHTKVEAFTDDEENAFVRELLSLDKEGNLVYEVPEFDTEDELNWNDNQACPYTLNWILEQLEKGSYFEDDDYEEEKIEVL